MSEAGNARESITIQGKTFKVNLDPYAEGHTVTAGEASALTQTRNENLRNNFAKKVADAIALAEKDGSDVDMDTLQSQFDSYADEYEFGVRTGGGRTGDPVMAEAMELMRDKVRAAIKRKGLNLKDVKAKDISAKAKAQFDANTPLSVQVLEVARANVARANEVAEAELDLA